ncbi:MAG: hypothetical protein ACREGC_04410, partial [Minisyncoccia bacterium]
MFGVNNDGSNSGFDLSSIHNLDLADITNKLLSYTNHQFEGIEIVEIERGGIKVVGFIISRTDMPISFIRPGTYDMGGGKQ